MAEITRTRWDTLPDQYEKDGYVIARNVLDRDLTDEARDHVEWLLKKHPDLRPEQLTHNLVPDDPFWVRLVSDDRLLDVARQFVGPNTALFASHYICKPPRDGQAVLWHQDGSYWPLDPMEVVTLWLAVDDSTPENGCMRVLPGTQSMTLQKLRERKDVANVLSSEIDLDDIDDADAVDIVLAPGDVSIHHPNIIHGSDPNNSEKWRRGLTIRYIPTTTRITEPDWPSALLLRGNPVAGTNKYVPFPEYREGEHMRFRGCENWHEQVAADKRRRG